MSTGRLKKLIPLLVLIPLVAGAAFVWSNLARWLSASDRLHEVDVLVVPAGQPDVRVPRAIELLDRGLADEVWVVPSTGGPVLREPDAVERFAEARDHGRDVHVLEKRSQALARDARLIADRLASVKRRDGRDRTVAVVTSPIEIARARMVFGRELGEDLRVWSDRSRTDGRDWTDLVAESANYVGALAVGGPSQVLLPGEVPPMYPLRALAGAFAVAVAIGAICRPLARRLGLVAIPRLWRAHTTPTPMLGGFAILLGLAGGIVAAGGVRLGALGAVAGAGVVVVALVGLVDDVAGLGAPVRLLWAAVAGAMAWLLGLRAIVVPGGDPLADAVNALLTLLWFVGITHALNVLDHIDGTTAGVGAASAATLAVAAALGGQFVVAIAAAALAGACLGYLVHNIHPARLFMGDMGALGLGFALAALGLALTPQPRPPLSMAVPVIALGVPIFDTILVTLARMGAGRSPSMGGTDHTSHRLLAGGLSVRQSGAVLWLGQVILGVVAVSIARTRGSLGWVLVAVVALAGIASLVAFLRMDPWRPPWQLEESERVMQSVHRAMRALRELEEALGQEAWRLSDPRAARSTQETLRRLERVRGLLESAPQASAPGAPSPRIGAAEPDA